MYVLEWCMPRVAPLIRLTPEVQAELQRIEKSRSASQALGWRARIVLAATQGFSNRQIAEWLHLTPATVGKWRGMFARYGLAGLTDWRRSGRPTKYGKEVWMKLRTLLRQPPPGPKARWTVRSLARALGLPRSTVHGMLRADGYPWSLKARRRRPGG
jgi:transposase